MANPAWGTKRICQSCGARYYDLNKKPIVCPKCGTVFNPEVILKSRRPKPEPEKAKIKEVKVAALAEDDIVLDDLGDDIPLDDIDDTVADDAFIEDAEELDSDDDIAPPIDGGKD